MGLLLRQVHVAYCSFVILRLDIYIFHDHLVLTRARGSPTRFIITERGKPVAVRLIVWNMCETSLTDVRAGQSLRRA